MAFAIKILCIWSYVYIYPIFRKFDIGIYVVYTSVDPLQVYMYEDEILVRFCTEVYPPLDVSNVHKYVVGDEYTSVSEVRAPSKLKYSRFNVSMVYC